MEVTYPRQLNCYETLKQSLTVFDLASLVSLSSSLKTCFCSACCSRTFFRRLTFTLDSQYYNTYITITIKLLWVCNLPQLLRNLLKDFEIVANGVWPCITVVLELFSENLLLLHFCHTSIIILLPSNFLQKFTFTVNSQYIYHHLLKD